MTKFLELFDPVLFWEFLIIMPTKKHCLKRMVIPLTSLLVYTLLTPTTMFIALKNNDSNKTQIYDSGFIYFLYS